MASDGSGSETDDNKPLDPVRIRSKLHHHLRTCSAAVKRARLFEVQRTVKKLKIATGEERDNLEVQLHALKATQHVQIAAIAIKNKLIKARLLPKALAGENDNLAEQFPLTEHVGELEASIGSSESMADQSTEDDRARSKLLSSKIVSEEVSNAVKVISALLRGEEPVKEARSNRNTPKSPLESTKELATKRMQAAQQQEALTNRDREADKVVEVASEDEETGSRDKSEMKPLKRSRQIQKGDERKDVDRQDNVERSTKKRRIDPKDSQSSDVASSDEEAVHSLPALSTGFVGGRGFNLGRDSEDEWSDGDAELDSIDEDADGTGNRKEARKNRMGQRARRAIWEKKFGRGANHLKLLEKEAKQRRAKEAPMRRERAMPQFRDAGWSGPLRKEPESVEPSRQTSRNLVPSKAEAELHPSWIAKQKQKERAEAAARDRGTAKKIVFD